MMDSETLLTYMTLFHIPICSKHKNISSKIKKKQREKTSSLAVYLSDDEEVGKEQQKCIAGLLGDFILSYFIRNFNFNLSLTPHSPLSKDVSMKQ